MTPSTPEVITVVGGYRVLWQGKLHVISKQRACSCGRPQLFGDPGSGSVSPGWWAACTRRYPAAATPRADLPDLPVAGVWLAASQGLDPARPIAVTSSFGASEHLRAARAKALQSASPYTLDVLSAFASSEARAEFVAAHSLTYAASA